MIHHRIQHRFSGVFGILWNGIITHIHGNQPENRSINGIVLRIVIKLRYQITDILTGRMNNLLTIIVLIQLRTVYP